MWISTANLKTMMVEAPIGSRARARGRYVSFFETLGELARRGVDVCICMLAAVAAAAAELRASAKDAIGREMRRCPRVHLKMIAVDGRLLYLGSANLTGAGLGAKGDGRRNFEMGIVTDNEAMLDAAQERFDRIWRGARVRAACTMRRECEKPLDARRLTSRGSVATNLSKSFRAAVTVFSGPVILKKCWRSPASTIAPRSICFSFGAAPAPPIIAARRERALDLDDRDLEAVDGARLGLRLASPNCPPSA